MSAPVKSNPGSILPLTIYASGKVTATSLSFSILYEDR